MSGKSHKKSHKHIDLHEPKVVSESVDFRGLEQKGLNIKSTDAIGEADYIIPVYLNERYKLSLTEAELSALSKIIASNDQRKIIHDSWVKFFNNQPKSSVDIKLPKSYEEFASLKTEFNELIKPTGIDSFRSKLEGELKDLTDVILKTVSDDEKDIIRKRLASMDKDKEKFNEITLTILYLLMEYLTYHKENDMKMLEHHPQNPQNKSFKTLFDEYTKKTVQVGEGKYESFSNHYGDILEKFMERVKFYGDVLLKLNQAHFRFFSKIGQFLPKCGSPNKCASLWSLFLYLYDKNGELIQSRYNLFIDALRHVFVESRNPAPNALDIAGYSVEHLKSIVVYIQQHDESLKSYIKSTNQNLRFYRADVDDEGNIVKKKRKRTSSSERKRSSTQPTECTINATIYGLYDDDYQVRIYTVTSKTLPQKCGTQTWLTHQVKDSFKNYIKSNKAGFPERVNAEMKKGEIKDVNILLVEDLIKSDDGIKITAKYILKSITYGSGKKLMSKDIINILSKMHKKSYPTTKMQRIRDALPSSQEEAKEMEEMAKADPKKTCEIDVYVYSIYNKSEKVLLPGSTSHVVAHTSFENCKNSTWLGQVVASRLMNEWNSDNSGGDRFGQKLDKLARDYYTVIKNEFDKKKPGYLTSEWDGDIKSITIQPTEETEFVPSEKKYKGKVLLHSIHYEIPSSTDKNVVEKFALTRNDIVDLTKKSIVQLEKGASKITKKIVKKPVKKRGSSSSEDEKKKKSEKSKDKGKSKKSEKSKDKGKKKRKSSSSEDEKKKKKSKSKKGEKKSKKKGESKKKPKVKSVPKAVSQTSLEESTLPSKRSSQPEEQEEPLTKRQKTDISSQPEEPMQITTREIETGGEGEN